MAQANLDVLLTADGRELVRTMKEAEEEVKRLQKQLLDTKDVKVFESLSAQLKKTKSELAALKTGQASTQLNKLGKSSVDATGDLINLGRVVQDAPFGFLGIANNLNPLIEGFKRTSVAAGGFRGALRSIGSSLKGAGGLSLAVSVASTALILFGDKLFGASASAKAAENAIKELAGAIAEEAVQLTTIVGLIENTNTSQKDREKALKLLNQEYKKYLNNLGIEEVTLGNLRTAYNAVIDSLLRQAVVKGLQAEITKEVEKTAASIIKLRKEAIKRANESKSNADKELTADEKAAAAKDELTKNIELNNQARRDGAIALADFNKQVVTTDILIQQQIDALFASIAPALQLTDQYADLGKEITGTGDKGDKAFDKIISAAKELSNFLDRTTIRSFNFEVDPRDSKQVTLEKAKEFIKRALDPLQRSSFPVKIGFFFNTDINFLQDKIKKAFEKIPAEYLDLQGKLQKEIDALTARNPILLAFRAKQEEIADFKKLIEEINAGISFQGVQALTSAFEGLFTAIVQGGNPLKAFFQTLTQTVGQLIARLAAAAAVAGILNALLGGKGFLGAKGFTQIFAKIAGFRADGGPVEAGKRYVVGERGPELFVPTTSGKIIPNEAFKGGVQGVAAGMQTVRVVGQISGRDIKLISTRQDSYDRRNVR